MASRLVLAQLFAQSGSGEVPPSADEAGAPKPTAEEFSIETPSVASSASPGTTSPGWRRRRPLRRSSPASSPPPRAGKRPVENADAATSPHTRPAKGFILHTSSAVLPSRDFQIVHESTGVSHNDLFLQKSTHMSMSQIPSATHNLAVVWRHVVFMA